jgi:hypothetical protein
MRKAQAALEFLTTYGWAFIVILVMIGALAYFGVLNPSKVTPNRCLVEAGLNCREYRLNSTTTSIILENKKGTGMSSDVGIPGACTLPGGYPATIVPDAIINITCTNVAAPFAGSLGNKVKIDFTITYTIPGGSLAQVAGGSIYTQVQ